jgi:hypothetical protein
MFATMTMSILISVPVPMAMMTSSILSLLLTEKNIRHS